MTETDFSDLLHAVELLASETDEIGALPRVERTPRQVLEASHELWARVTATGAQEIQANLLLGSKGVDLPQLSQKLESLSSKKTFEPLESIPDTDIKSFMKNELENTIISLHQASHADSLEKWEVEHMEDLEYDWNNQKEETMNSMLGRDGDFLDIPLVQESRPIHSNQSVPWNENLEEPNKFLNSVECLYGQAVMEYNQSVIKGDPKPNLIEKFGLLFNDQMVNEMWTVVKYMTQIPPQGKIDPIDARNMPAVKIKMISQARNYLENRYRLFMSSVVQNSMRYPEQGGESSTYSLVRNFVSIRVPRGLLGLDAVEVDGHPLWPLIYYCLRCGDIQSALKCVQQAGRGFEEICMALEELKGSIQRKVSPKLEKLIRTHYKRSIRNDTDPFKRIIFCILGGCDVNDEHSEIAKTADDYLWLKLNQVNEEEEENDITDGSEFLRFSYLQRLIIEEYGEVYYNAKEQPYVYFQLLFLTGQWEAAVDFLIRSDKLQVHGVHLAIVLHELDLLALTRDVKSPILVIDPDDPKPMHRVNLVRIINIYVHKFENQHLLEALHYYYCLRSFNSIEDDDKFPEYVIELLLRTRKIEKTLGCLELDGSRSPGIIDQFRLSKDSLDRLIKEVAKVSKKTGQYEDAVKLYDLLGKYKKVLTLMSIMLCRVVTQVESEPGSLRSRLAAYAENITTRYSGIQVECEEEIQRTFYILKDLLKFFDYCAKKQNLEAFDTIQKSNFIPLSLVEVDEKVKNFDNLSEEVFRNIPHVLLAIMNILYEEYCNIKRHSQISDSSKKQIALLKERAKALTSFAGTISFRISGDTNTKLLQMEILMDY